MQEVRNPRGLAVEANGLVKTFDKVRAVDSINLEVRRGQVFGVLGPNGAGKTTMLKMLATLLPIDGGSARIFGVDVAANPHQVRQLVGVTGQYASVDENLTGWENLVLFGRLLLHFKEEGYQWFSLGMAPLAGLSENPVAPLWHKMGRAVYDHGEALYNFHGLRAFKNKFDPIWSPRYMVVAGGLNPMLAIADATVLISGGIRGVIAK